MEEIELYNDEFSLFYKDISQIATLLNEIILSPHPREVSRKLSTPCWIHAGYIMCRYVITSRVLICTTRTASLHFYIIKNTCVKLGCHVSSVQTTLMTRMKFIDKCSLLIYLVHQQVSKNLLRSLLQSLISMLDQPFYHPFCQQQPTQLIC